jgi:predicted NBD/HSP70 family sugar kinase
MSSDFIRIKPQFIPPLDEDFCPPILANHAFRKDVTASGRSVPLIFGLVRDEKSISRYETIVFSEDHPRADENLYYAERILKFLLWQKGGWKVYVGGPQSIGDYLKKIYASDNERRFDTHFMGEDVYDHPFTITICSAVEVPAEMENTLPLGGHLDGCRIGFDLGGSDRKVSAVVNGETIFSEEVVWDPIPQSDPNYHYTEIMEAIKKAASKMPHLDAIGGSAAGVYVNNKVRVASLFRGVPEERYDAVRNMFLRIRDEMQVPLEIVNDGEVTALAGAMSLGDNGILGIAMGTSQAAGYVNLEGNITSWLNELAFVPVDYNPNAAVEEWSGDRGVGALYFSQQAVFRLAPMAGIQVPVNESKAAQLKFVQEKLEAGHEGAFKIWQSIGYYLGYTLANYADFYQLRHVLILGRVTSGKGGDIILQCARQVLDAEFPEIARQVNIQLPDEKSRRVGQSIAAASLPKLK